MTFRRIPGLRQDHLRRYYHIEVNDRGEQRMAFVEEPPMTPRALAALEPVDVTSQSGLPPHHPRVLSGACYAVGTVFRSLMCYQERGRSS